MAEIVSFSVPNGAHAPRRERVNLAVGALVQHHDSVFRIAELLDFNTLVGVEVETGRAQQLRISELGLPSAPAEPTDPSRSDLAGIGDASWQEAQRRYAAIKPFIGEFVVSKEDIEQRARELKVGRTTLYRWIRAYRKRGQVTDLVPRKRGRPTGTSEIDPRSEAVISEVIDTFYLQDHGPAVTTAVLEVQRLCAARGIDAPSPMTVRRRIQRIPEKKRLRGRGQKALAESRFQPVPGKLPHIEYRLALVQMDHTEVDIILVDDVNRKPIGRPWITVALDVHSRMVAGYYLSLDAPSEASIGLCLAHAVLPKEEWLALHGIDAPWPVWGFPRTMHVDNGSDFRSQGFERACLQYGVHMEFRPVKVPRFGGHVERFFGTYMHEVHQLPGTTKSSVADKGEYDAEKHATMTFADFETWTVEWITRVYHQRKHSELPMTPLKQWELSVMGNAEVAGVGMPARPTDRLTVQLDLMPSEYRTVQNNGVSWDNCTYYDAALHRWCGATDPESGKKRKFIFRRDPRDIKFIWFFDPELKEYFRIPFADESLPSISLWEYNRVKAHLAAQGRDSVDPHELLRAITSLRERVDASVKTQKKANRAKQKRTEHARERSPAQPVPPTAVSPGAAASLADGLDDLLADDDEVGSFGEFA